VSEFVQKSKLKGANSNKNKKVIFGESAADVLAKLIAILNIDREKYKTLT